ncbi:HET-domain-containing protein, partial [Ophiobolus disseminans]
MSHSSAFQHQPLDRTKSSLRLLTIRSNRSPKGLIKCRMWHDDVETIYTCLSYVWGSGNERHEIEINGRTFLVRQNLWDFLDVARKKYGDDQQAFWIDALCIDQDSLSERNHQVAQMGLIYSKADDVIAWLGFSEGIGRAFAFCNELNALKPATRTEAHKLWGREWSQTLSSDWFEFQSHQYWTRAWITQEVLLARRLKILVNDSEFDPSQCSALRLLLPDINTDDVRYPSTVRGWSGSNAFNTYLQVACKKKIYEKKKLVDLFEELPRRQCQIPRDQIYSLLSLASDTTSISVDYGSSDEQFISHVLDTFEDSL